MSAPRRWTGEGRFRGVVSKVIVNRENVKF